MGRKNRNSGTKRKRREQHARGKARKQGLHRGMDSPGQRAASDWLMGRRHDQRAA